MGVCSESMADYQASIGMFRKIRIESSIRFGPITVMWNREHVAATLMDFIRCLTQHAHGLHG